MSILGGFDAYNKYWLSHSSDTFDRGTWSRGFRYKQQSPSTGWPFYKHSWSSWRPHSCILLLIVLRYYVLCTSDHCLTFLFFTSRSLPIPSSRRTFGPYDSLDGSDFVVFPGCYPRNVCCPGSDVSVCFCFHWNYYIKACKFTFHISSNPCDSVTPLILLLVWEKKGIHSMVPFTLPNRYV